nr:hypothetical protein [Jannaschia formosa]
MKDADDLHSFRCRVEEDEMGAVPMDADRRIDFVPKASDLGMVRQEGESRCHAGKI